MADPQEVQQLIEYYVNLLIIQYHNKPKARAEIGLIADQMVANNIFLDIQNAYDIETSVGKQLDVIGKYVGVDRYYSEIVLENYFSLITYDETISLPSSPPRWGFSDYTTYDDYAYNGTLDYDEIITTENALFDPDFRTLIKLKILINYSNFSHKSIDDNMYAFFGTSVRPESNGGMHMIYFIDSLITPILQAILAKQLLPVPMGVGMQIVEGITGDMFALTSYNGYETPFGYGFSDYSDYDTLLGQVLTYSQIVNGNY